MSKIYQYELRRGIRNKFFLISFLAILLYGWMNLEKLIIGGVAYTAPFSPWSFGTYLSRILPIVSMLMLFFLETINTGNSKRVQVLIYATPVEPRNYIKTRYLAILTQISIVILTLFLLGSGYLIYYFKSAVPVVSLLLVFFASVIPLLMFISGLGLACLEFLPAPCMYLLMLFFGGISFVQMPYCLDLYGSHYYQTYPLRLKQLDPVFSVSNEFILLRIFMFLIGLGLCILTLKKKAVVQ